jgi:AcrR family transcriptional regulator
MPRKPKKGSVSEDGLTEEAIVKAARLIVADSGTSGLTMRRLSDDLGVALGATYHHVPNRQALLRLVAKDIDGDLVLPSPDSGPWIDRVRDAVLDYAGLVGAHPGMAAEIAGDSVGMTPLALNRFLADTLRSEGFSQTDIDAVMSALFFYVGGLMLVAPEGVSELGERGLVTLANFETGLRILLVGFAVEFANPQMHRPAG